MEEDQLIKKAAKGDESAFEKIAGAYASRIYSVCLRVLKNPSDAEDAAQDAALKIYLNIRRFRFDSKFSTWVYTVSRNCALDALRRNKKELSIDELSESGFDLPDTGEAPEESAEKSDTNARIIVLINSLPLEQRQCIVLKDVDGYSIEEMVQMLGIPEGTVKSRLHRGREKLKELIDSSGIVI